MTAARRKKPQKKQQNVSFVRISSAVGILVICLLGGIGLLTAKHTGQEQKMPDAGSNAVLPDTEMSNTEMPDIEMSDTEMPDTKMPDTENEDTSAMHLQNSCQEILQMNAGELVCEGMLPQELLGKLFLAVPMDENVIERIQGSSYTENDTISTEDLRYLKMLYWDFDGNTCVGEMIVNEKIADRVLAVFKQLYENQYPIQHMVLVDEYGADDAWSMSENNTSAFNYRKIAGSSKLSNHSYGMAIDLNPRLNPCVRTKADGSISVEPENGAPYADRSSDFPGKIDENDLAYRLFTEAGFTWGGHWNSLKDYQHFEWTE